MLNKYKYALSNYPLFIDHKYKNVMIEILKEYQKIDGNFINKSKWEEVLKIETNEL